MTGRTATLAVTILAGGLLAACSSDDAATDPPQTDASTVTQTTDMSEPTAPPATEKPTTTPAPTTTIDPRVLAGDTYIEIITKLNCSRQIVEAAERQIAGNDGLLQPRDWPAIQGLFPAYSSISKDTLGSMDALIAYPNWPDDVQPDIDALVRELADEATFWQGLSISPDFEAWANLAKPAGGNSATIIRSKLGLETNVGTTRDFCADLAG